MFPGEVWTPENKAGGSRDTHDYELLLRVGTLRVQELYRQSWLSLAQPVVTPTPTSGCYGLEGSHCTHSQKIIKWLGALKVCAPTN